MKQKFEFRNTIMTNFDADKRADSKNLVVTKIIPYFHRRQ